MRRDDVRMPESVGQDMGGKGPSMVFLHANGYPPECYLPLLDLFREGFHVRALQLRPLWQSPTAARRLPSWHELSDDLLAWLGDQSAQPVVAVGHSLGAIVALRAALHEAWRFRALVLLDPVLATRERIMIWRLARYLPFGHPLWAVIRRAQRRRSVFGDVDEAFNAYRRHSVFRRLTDERLKDVIKGLMAPREGRMELRYSPAWEAQIYRVAVWNDLDLWEDLPSLGIPTLMIRGAQSQTLTAEAASAASRLSDLIELVTIEGATHLVPLECPLEVHQVANRFLQRVPARRIAGSEADSEPVFNPA
ncbi:MAG TPA: alpha/beta hydrolase [Anaerolineales bacterium]|nr:alpha/beta hydrolase [Anaerolineales bacterium]